MQTLFDTADKDWMVVGPTVGNDGVTYLRVRWRSPANAREGSTRAAVALEDGEPLVGALAIGGLYDPAAHAAQREAAKAEARTKAKARAPARARKDDGTSQGDDPATPEVDEAFETPPRTPPRTPPKAAAPAKTVPKKSAAKRAAPKRAAPKRRP